VAYRLKMGRSPGDDLLRIIEKQTRLASRALGPGRRPLDSRMIHATRRRVKKALTAIHLAEAALDGSPKKVLRRLKGVKRSLTAIADGEAVIQTVERLAAREPSLSRESIAVILRRLQRAERGLERSADTRQVLARAARVLIKTADDVHEWRTRYSGFRTVGRGLKHIYRRARRAMRAAQARPDSRSYHHWRKCSKEHWLALRLLEVRCQQALIADQGFAEVLDEALGEHHNIVLLTKLLVNRHPLSRTERLRWLRALRAYRQDLRTQAAELGGKVFADRPSDLVKRAKAGWNEAKSSRNAVEGVRRWRPAA
jgi:hypothetical protein